VSIEMDTKYDGFKNQLLSTFSWKGKADYRNWIQKRGCLKR
jgi:hypothetical protein